MSSNKYLSERGAGEITAQQYIMEQFLILLARQSGSALPDKFWTLDKYKKLWKRHVRSINTRIAEYGEVPIIRALKDKKLARLKSFDKAAAWLWEPVLKKHKKQYDLECEQQECEQHIKDIAADPTNRRNFNTDNTLSKLKQLDNPI